MLLFVAWDDLWLYATSGVAIFASGLPRLTVTHPVNRGFFERCAVDYWLEIGIE